MNPSARSRCAWKIPYLKGIVDSSSHCIPFVALTETWLKPYVQDAQISLGNYNILRCDRSTRSGGGVVLYTHQDLPIQDVDTLDIDTCQLLMCSSETAKVIYCVLYRSPSAPVKDFHQCLQAISSYLTGKDDYEVCLMGDFNIPNVSWDPPSINSPSPAAEELLRLSSDSLLSQYVLEPTRKGNILDLFFTNNASLVTHVSARDTELSDHRLVEVYLSYNPCQPNYSETPIFEPAAFRSLDFTKADFQAISSVINEIDWNVLSKELSDEEFCDKFTQVLLKVCIDHTPLKIPPTRHNFSKLRSLSRRKRTLQAQLEVAVNTPCTPKPRIDALTRKISAIHFDIREVILQEQRYREEKAVGVIKSNPKYFYSYTKRFSRQKQNISMLFNEQNKICGSPKDIADVLSNQFQSVFSDPDNADPEAADFQVPPIRTPHNPMAFTEHDIQKAIGEIRTTAAPGPDGIPPVLLKNCKDAISLPIFLIWQRSFDTGRVPDFYKSSNVTPLYKKGSRSVASNYRPVSLTSHIVKIFERVIRKNLVGHLESNKLLTDHQHGFRKGHSCLTQLLHHFDEVLQNYLDGSDTDCIYLDYAKAFDKVDHGLLIRKLKNYGVNPKMIDWVESFLTGRFQQVAVNGVLSTAALILSGVPQGTVLGPILFLIFINDITSCICNCTMRCFADDTRIMRRISRETDVPILQSELDNVVRWSSRNNMALHEDKFEYIKHNDKRSLSTTNDLIQLPEVADLHQYQTSKGTLSPVSQLKDLGVTISGDLSWSLHIKTIADKARQKASWVLSVFHTRSPHVMITLYKSMIRSLLEYCCPLWNPSKIADIQELEGVQRTFTSRIAGCYELNYWERLKKLSLMSLQRRRERYIILHMWKLLHGVSSNDLRVQFTKRSSRSGIQANIPSICKGASAAQQSAYDASFAVMGPKLWNSIPFHINEEDGFDTFKSKLTTFLLRIPDQPPTRGYTTTNSNSILAWRNNSSTTELWGGSKRL